MANKTENPEEENKPYNDGMDESWQRRLVEFEDGHSADTDSAEESSSSGLDEQESSATAGVSKDDDLQTQESQAGNWKTDVSEQAEPGRIRHFLGRRKNQGIILSISALITIMGFMFSLMSGALGIVNLKETVISKLSQRADNVMTHRLNRVMVKKMSQDFTSGCTIKVKCRYKGMTTREVRKFNQRNIGNGVRVVTEKSPIPGRQKVVAIEKYEVPDKVTIEKDGTVKGKTTKSYTPREFRSALRNDPSIAKSVLTFHKPYVQYHSGNAARAMMKRIGINLGKKTVTEGEGKNEVEKQRSQQRRMIEAAQMGSNTDLDDIAQSRYDELDGDAKDAVQSRTSELEGNLEDPSTQAYSPDPSDASYESVYGRLAKKIQNIGGGVTGAIHPNPLHFLMNYCTVRLLVQTANQVRKVNQTIQLIKFSALFFTIADQIKAGDATPQTTAAMGAAMSILMAKNSDGLSGFDSMGFNWITRGSVRRGYSEDVTKFQNGGSAAGFLGNAVSATTSGLGGACKIANSDALAAGMAAATLGGITLAAKKLVGEVVEVGVKKYVSKKITETVANNSKGKLIWKAVNNKVTKTTVPTAFFLFGTGPIIELMARSGSKTVAQDLVGPDGGNAFYAGAGALNSKTSQAQGLEPITADEAVAQDKGAVRSSLGRANIEGIDQLDITDHRSFSNNFATALLPAMSNFSSIYTSAFSVLPQQANAADDEKAQYEFCQDEQYMSADIKVSTDPFCNPQYGFDMSVVNGPAYDPEGVANYLYDNSLVDAEGEPIGDFSDFITKCMESEATIGQDEEGSVDPDCVKRDQKTRNMRIYCLDTSIDSDMKSEIAGNCATQDAENIGSNSEAAASGELPTGSAQELAKQIVDSGKVSAQGGYMSQIQDIANGSGSCPVSEKILGLILLISQTHTIQISSLNRKCTGTLTASGEGSLHYGNGGGRAVDIAMVDGLAMNYSSANEKKKAKSVFEIAINAIPSNSELGQINSCGLSGIDTKGIEVVPDSCNHIHIGIPD